VVVALAIGCGCHSPRSTPQPRVYVSNENAGTVSIIEPASGTTIATIAVGKRPRGIRVSRDGHTLYVALSGSPKGGPGVDESTLPPPDRSADGIGVVDLDRLQLVATIPSGQDPESFDLVGDRWIVVSNEDARSATIVDLGARRVHATVPVGEEPEGVATAPDGTVWVTSEADNSVSVLDPEQAKVIATIPTGARPRGIAFNHELAVITGENDSSVTIVDIASRKATGRVTLPMSGALPPRPMGVVLDRSGRYAFVTTGRAGGVAVIDLSARELARTIEQVGKRPWGIARGRDGMLYTANGPSDDIAVIDPEAGRVVRRIASHGSPWGVASI
jgi:YVTN family beta-propeller protein